MKKYSDVEGDGGSDVLGQVMAQRRQLAERLASVRHVVAVASGKGGVGKSTICAGLAMALARRGDSVAVLDADLNGPSLPRLLGLSGGRVRLEAGGLGQPEAALGIRVMSSELFLGGDDEPLRYEGPRGDAYTWRPTAEATTLREFLAYTEWGERDWLLVDMPPGAERLPTLLDLVPRLAGAVFVTLGSPVSLRVVRKSLAVAKEHGVTVLGVVENMAGYCCEGCGTLGPLFGRPGEAEAAATEVGVPFLGAVPFDAGVAVAAEEGTALPGDPSSLAARALEEIARTLAQRAAGMRAEAAP